MKKLAFVQRKHKLGDDGTYRCNYEQEHLPPHQSGHKSPDAEAMIGLWIGTAESLAKTKKNKKNIERIEAYQKRNAAYTPTLAVWWIESDIHLGTAKTHRRHYTCRIKKQSRR